MIGLKITTHFNPTRVFEAAHKKKLRAYNIAGGRTRLIARRKVRKRTRNYTPTPNEPPRVANTKLSKYRNGIRFAYDRRTDSMVIGPMVKDGENTAWVFETGGNIRIDIPGKKGRKRTVQARFRKFPVMGPTAKDAVPYYGNVYAQLRTS